MMNQTEDQGVDKGYYQTSKYRLRWWTLAVLSVSLVIIGLDNTILNVALPTIQKELGASFSQLQWMVDAYVLVFASLLLTMGALGDRFGRKRTLQIGLVIFGVSSFFAAHATSSTQLIVSRSVMGIGGALIMPSTLSIITDVFPREERGRAIGIWTGMAAVGIATGPALGGWLLENFSWGSSFPFDITGDMLNWGSVFLINLPVVIVALIAGLLLVPESRDPAPPRLDLLGAALSMSTLMTLVYGIIEAPSRGWLDTVVLSSFVGSFILGAGFIYRELHASHPMLDLSFFRNPRFSTGVGAISMAFFALFGMIFILAQYLQFVHGYTALQAGIRIMPFALGMMIGAANSHRLVARMGTNKVAAMGLTILAVVCASLYFWQVDTPYWIIGISVVVMSFGVSNTMAPATDAVMGAVPLAKAGVGSAMNDTTRQVGGAFGVAILGSILNTLYSSSMADNIAGLPPEAAAQARDSVGAAVNIGVRIGGVPGQALADAARGSFVDGMHVAFMIAAGVALVAAVIVLKFMPPKHLGGGDHAGGN
ncbi:MAG: MFS transporter [Actinomycetota bacterium]